MYIYRGGQLVEEGVYLDAGNHGRVVLKASGFLPGSGKDFFFKVPESYLLIPVFCLGLFLSMALPYGIGIVLFGALFLIHNSFYSLLSFCEQTLKELLPHIGPAYKPGSSFFSGRAKKIKSRHRIEKKKE